MVDEIYKKRGRVSQRRKETFNNFIRRKGEVGKTESDLARQIGLREKLKNVTLNA